MLREARAIFEAAVEAALPENLLRHFDIAPHVDRPLASYEHVWVLGLGKASLAMASVLENKLGDRIDGGLVVTVRGYGDTLPARYSPPERIIWEEGGHPIPDEGSVRAARHILRLARYAGPKDLVLLIVSGGGSSVCADFPNGISLMEAKVTFRLLLEAGVDISAINCVRKQISTIAGGRLAGALHPAEGLALVVSDVVGDDLRVIASGPTVTDESGPEDAIRVLRAAELWEHVPESVRHHLEQSTLKEASPIPTGAAVRMRHHIIGSNENALLGAEAAARELGYQTHILERGVTGEAREVAARLLGRVLAQGSSHPACFLAGGESTVTVRGSGSGGRNQEMALAGAIVLDEHDTELTFLSGGTDGIDGSTNAAGAVVNASTVSDARIAGLDPVHFLRENDSYSFFQKVGGLLRTGPTQTNVMDVQVILTGPDRGV